MRTPIFTKKFEKDLERCKRRQLNTNDLRSIMNKLIAAQPLEPRYKNHGLSWIYTGCWECHIHPDWLLVYIFDTQKNTITFVRTGTHSDLF